MNRFIPLLLMLLLLTGCAAQVPVPMPTETSIPETVPQNISFLKPEEEKKDVQRFSLPADVSGFLTMGDNLLFFSGNETTALTLVDPAAQQIMAVYETGMVLNHKNTGIQLLNTGLSYFNEQAEETVVLDSELQEVSRITAPDKLTGIPLLSGDGNVLYYCTASAVRALDTQTGISRILREAIYPAQSLSALLLEDTVLQVGITEADGTCHTLFLSADSGRLLGDHNGSILPHTIGQRFSLCLQQDQRKTILFGCTGEEPSILYPKESAEDCFFFGNRILTTFRQESGLTLDLYDLDSGLRTARLSLQPGETLQHASVSENGSIWLFCHTETGQPILCRWNADLSETGDTANYISPRYTRQNPDYDALAACSLMAQDMSSRHGIEILIYTDAAEMQPWDYALEYEYDAAVLRRELELLDIRLSNYPPDFLRTLAGKFSGIKICIVKQIEGTPESGSVEIASGIQFWDEYEAYIVLAAGHNTEQTLYHELCHLMDTIVLTESTAYDQWEKWNPPGFRYANSAIHSMKADDWRQAGWESFLDDYSMSYAKEDRARIMEYAMADGNAHRFESPYLQAKLQLLCTGIREAFDLESYETTFLWEQYLQSPIAPNR